ncbi:hypothetical protein [Sphaerisporangium fuscum]|uniref:hypothetical protein n=1 Tax=Sphaerisporangium fuscum TaxID=2835868 RepID=UPI001BDD22BD|nr:hypothetical protein [Sphaerisporangium fuscum]
MATTTRSAGRARTAPTAATAPVTDGHGDQDQADARSRPPLRSTLWRGRRMIRPVLVLVALQLAGWLLSVVPMALAWSLGVSALGGIIAIAAARSARGSSTITRTTAAGSLWLNLAALFGPFGWVAALLWAGGVVMAIPYWHRHKSAFIPASARTTAHAPQADLGDGLSLQQRIWAERVAAPRKALPGSVLGTPEPVTGGWAADVQLVSGEQETATAVNALGKIASAYDKNTAQVMVEPPKNGVNSQARITVIERSDHLTRTRYLEHEGTPIDLSTGIARVGFFADSAPAHWQYWSTTGGAQHGLIAGGTGCGKSGFIGTLLSQGHICPAVVNVLLDPQGGQSQPDWNDHVPLSAMGVEDCMTLLRKIDYAMERRAEYLGRVAWVDERGRERRGKPFLLPTGNPGDMVLLAMLVEEAPLLLKDPTYGGSNGEAVALLAKGGRTWRKAGASENLVTQFPGLEDLVAQPLRSMLIAGGTVVSFRTGDSVSQGMLGMLNDPSKLPQYFDNGQKTHGLGYIVGIDRRQATFRSVIPEDPYGIASRPPAGRLDEVTAAFFDDFDNTLRKAKRTKTVPAPQPAHQDAPRATSGDVAAAVEQTLATSARPLDVAAILHAAQRTATGATLGDVKASLKTLEGEGRIRRQGDLWAPATTS